MGTIKNLGCGELLDNPWQDNLAPQAPNGYFLLTPAVIIKLLSNAMDLRLYSVLPSKMGE